MMPPKRTGRETLADLRRRTGAIIAKLKTLYPDAHCELDYRNAYQLLVATILSAQCTDVRVNLVTPALFARWPDAYALARADPAELEAVDSFDRVLPQQDEESHWHGPGRGC